MTRESLKRRCLHCNCKFEEHMSKTFNCPELPIVKGTKVKYKKDQVFKDEKTH